MKKVFIVRHGKTIWNLQKKLQGAKGDSPLLKSNQSEYVALAKFLDKFNFEKIYTSPLNRSIKTARATIEKSKVHYQKEIIVNQAFREVSFGSWEGQTKESIIQKYPKLFAKFSLREDDPRLSALGIEEFVHARKRFKNEILKIIRQIEDNKNILIFSHGAISQLGIKALTNNENISGLKNMSTSIIGSNDDENFRIESYNGFAYLNYFDNSGNTTIM